MGVLLALLAPAMRNAWTQGPAVAIGSGLTTTILTWLLIRFAFEPLYRKVEDRESALRAQSDRQEFGAQLNRALERARSEADALNVTMRAVKALAADLPAEVLVADSSRAHLRRQAGSGTDALPAAPISNCHVVSPWDCPAMASSQAHHFPDSRALDSCPFLSERAEAAGVPLTSHCLPMASRGQAIGVLHAVRPAGQPINADLREQLGIVASRAGATIGATRAFVTSQLQASTDPLTGLLNRRSFEARAMAVLENAESFGLIMADLDRFKMLNDVHGHSTGDRALRRFAEVVRSVTGSDDVVARMGGEEFVVLLPGRTAQDAVEVAERLRSQLSVRTGGSEPAFTVSLGVAEGLEGDELHDVIAVADQALFAAKAAGRDRIVVANTAAPGGVPQPRDADADSDAGIQATH